MENKITMLLERLELDNNVKIVFVTETGSRANRTHTERSDYDMKGVYIDLDPVKRNKHVLFEERKTMTVFCMK